MPEYKVDKNIEMPKRVPLESMEVGESFEFPKSKRQSIATMASKLKRETGKEFTIKQQDEESARIWRLK